MLCGAAWLVKSKQNMNRVAKSKGLRRPIVIWRQADATERCASTAGKLPRSFGLGGAIIAALLACCSAGCGGGGDASPDAPRQVIEMLGDSLTEATILPVPPAQRLRELLNDRYDVQARAVSGATIRQSLTGEANGEIVWRWLPFADQARSDRASIIVLRWGGSDAVAGTDPEAFRNLLTQAVRDAKNFGAVYVVGVIRSVPFALPSATTDRINREVAATEGVPFIDLRDLPFDQATDTADSVHPSQGYSDRIMSRVAEVLKGHS
jgi:lysophospholipase L1-like esterase